MIGDREVDKYFSIPYLFAYAFYYCGKILAMVMWSEREETMV